MKKTLPKAGERHPAGVEGMYAVTGETVSGPGGWHRRDIVFIGDKEVAAVHVREAHGRVSWLTECQGEYVMGKDVEWVACKCFYTPPTSLGEQVRHAQAVVASWSPEKRASVQLEGGFFHTAPAERRRGARP
jgi:hypothetical protein